MAEWHPATFEEVQKAVDRERAESDPETWTSIAPLLVTPYPCLMERFGSPEQAYVVATTGSRVVFYDDVDEIFGTADEVHGRLENCAMYRPLILAAREAVREST